MNWGAVAGGLGGVLASVNAARERQRQMQLLSKLPPEQQALFGALQPPQQLPNQPQGTSQGQGPGGYMNPATGSSAGVMMSDSLQQMRNKYLLAALQAKNNQGLTPQINQAQNTTPIEE